MSLALHGKEKEKAERFYNQLLDILLTKDLPFMIGGTFAYNEYTGLDRDTGDIDIITTEKDYPRILKVLSDAGYKTELAEIELKWLAKVYNDDYLTDIIFAQRNGLYKIDNEVLSRAQPGKVLGHQVKLEPVEDLIASKCYVQNRHRADTGDVVHLILRQGRNIDWQLLYNKMEPHWELLAAHVLFFLFIYPSERSIIPDWFIEKLLIENVQNRIAHPPTKQKITRGLLLSTDYEVGVSQWGFVPIQELK
jgi:hypothetical protein